MSKLTFRHLANHILNIVTVSVIPKSCVWIHFYASIKTVITVRLTIIPVGITNWLIIRPYMACRDQRNKEL